MNGTHGSGLAGTEEDEVVSYSIVFTLVMIAVSTSVLH